MNPGNSKLFKEFARPILAPYAGASEPRSETPGLEISAASITNVTPRTFDLSLQGRFTGAGRLGNVGSIDVLLSLRGNMVGRLSAPRESLSGSSLNIVAQRVEILDALAFAACKTKLDADGGVPLASEKRDCTAMAFEGGWRYTVHLGQVLCCDVRLY